MRSRQLRFAALALVLSIPLCGPALADEPDAADRREAANRPDAAAANSTDPAGEDVPPEIADDFARAETAWQDRDYRQARDLAERMLQKTPDHARVRYLHSVALVATGERERGLAAAEELLKEKTTVLRLLALIKVLEESAAPRPLLQSYRNRLYETAQTAVAGDGDDPLPLIVVAYEALSRNDDQRFRTATARLVERFPDRMESHYFNGIRAARDGDWITADREIREAGRLGLPQQEVDRLLDLGIRTHATVWRTVYLILYLMAAWIAGLVLLFVAGKALSTATLRSVERSDPNRGVSPFERLLRKTYRAVIVLAGLGYYVSLPIVVLLAIALPAALIYGMFQLPVISLKVLLLVGLLGLASLWAALSGIRACFTRVPDEDPGRPLTPDEAPGLWQLSREVAEKVGTRPIDEIWLTPGTAIAVYERGGWLQRTRDRGRRALILGAYALDGLGQNALRSILAHEYGHFRHRDTAGGEVAMRVNRAMALFAEAIVRQGLAAAWNVSLHFLRLYHFLFRRISYGASRLQEVLADRVAVLAYGPSALEDGLTHVIRRDADFHFAVSQTIEESLRTAEPAANFYRRRVKATADDRRQLARLVAEQIAESSSADDTHPSPRERFALARRIDAAETDLPDAPAWDLFADRDPLLAEMHEELSRGIAEQTGAVQQAHRQVADYYSELLRSTPSDTCYEFRGAARAALCEYEAAIADFTEALRLDPNRASAHLRRALAFAELKEHERAAEDLEAYLQLAESEPPDPEELLLALSKLGECRLETDEGEAAVTAFNRAIETEPTSVAAWIGRARGWLLSDRRDQAISDLTQAIELWPECAEAYSERGLIHKEQGDYAAALDDYSRAVELDPRQPEPKIRLAWLLATCPAAEFRDPLRAVKLAAAACDESDGDDPIPLDTLAAAYAAAKEFDRAVATIDRALPLLADDEGERAAARARRELYRQRLPYHEPSTSARSRLVAPDGERV